MSDGSTAVERALFTIATDLRDLDVRFAVVGGIAVSARAEVRFTRDVDVAVAVDDDAGFESLVRALRARGYAPRAIVEYEQRNRLATVRLVSPTGVTIDLMAASCGIEDRVVDHATSIQFESIDLPVARAEELLAMKVLSSSPTRPQDRLDAIHLLLAQPGMDLEIVRADLAAIIERGYHRDQDLHAKLAEIRAETARHEAP